MIFVSFSIEKYIIPYYYSAHFVPPKLLYTHQIYLYLANFLTEGARWCSCLGTSLQARRSRVRFLMVSLEFSIT